MTYTDVWIGELADGPDPLDWGGDWRIGNTPRKSVCPVFPPAPAASRSPFRAVLDDIGNGVLRGKQIDWGAWAAVVSKDDITSLLERVYGKNPTFGGLDHLRVKFDAVCVAVAVLPADGRFALVAEEF